MAATLVLSESNGAGEVVTDNISNINFGSTDAPNIVAATFPIVIGLNSYRKYIRIKVSAMGGSNTIDVFKVYKSAGAYVTGESITSNSILTGFFRITYSTPGRTSPGSWWDNPISTTLPAVSNLGIDAFGTPDDAGADTAQGTITIAGSYSQYWGMITVSTGATPVGAANQKTFTYQWNEA